MDREYLITCVNLFKKISQAKERIPTQRMINLAQQMGAGVIDTTGINQIIENMLSFFVLNMYTLFNSFETIKAHIGIYLRAKYELSSFDATLLSKLICHSEVKYLEKRLQSSTKSANEWHFILQREHVEYRKAGV